MFEEALSYEDVLLVPKFSKISSRSQVSTEIKLPFHTFSHPLIPANMKTIVGPEMIKAIIESNGLAILHRFLPLSEQLEIVKTTNNHKNLGVSLGVKENDKEAAKQFHQLGNRIFCIDIAHGDSQACLDMIKFLKTLPNSYIIAGNVATGEGAVRLWKAGANIIKLGVGSGSICLTRIETGNGVPQLSAVIDVYNERKKHFYNPQDYPFIADGGIRTAGDVVKALCYADFVMAGNLFAGCQETPGEVFNIAGRKVKEYTGSSTYKTKHVEGVAALVEPKGSFKETLNKIKDGLQSGCSYQGAKNLEELKLNPKFVKITQAGIKESNHHDVFLR